MRDAENAVAAWLVLLCLVVGGCQAIPPTPQPVVVTPSPPPQPVTPDPTPPVTTTVVVDAYVAFARAMDNRLGLFTASDAAKRWGHPDEQVFDGQLLRVTWYQRRRAVPIIPREPEPGSVERSVFNLSAATGDGAEWPITTRLHVWFDSWGRMQQWRLQLQDGTIYQLPDVVPESQTPPPELSPLIDVGQGMR